MGDLGAGISHLRILPNLYYKLIKILEKSGAEGFCSGAKGQVSYKNGRHEGQGAFVDFRINSIEIVVEFLIEFVIEFLEIDQD